MDELARDTRLDLREIRDELGKLSAATRALCRHVDKTPAAAREAVEDGLSVNWKSVATTLLAAGTGIGVPIAAALILAPG